MLGPILVSKIIGLFYIHSFFPSSFFFLTDWVALAVLIAMYIHETVLCVFFFGFFFSLFSPSNFKAAVLIELALYARISLKSVAPL